MKRAHRFVAVMCDDCGVVVRGWLAVGLLVFLGLAAMMSRNPRAWQYFVVILFFSALLTSLNAVARTRQLNRERRTAQLAQDALRVTHQLVTGTASPQSLPPHLTPSSYVGFDQLRLPAETASILETDFYDGDTVSVRYVTGTLAQISEDLAEYILVAAQLCAPEDRLTVERILATVAREGLSAAARSQCLPKPLQLVEYPGSDAPGVFVCFREVGSPEIRGEVDSLRLSTSAWAWVAYLAKELSGEQQTLVATGFGEALSRAARA